MLVLPWVLLSVSLMRHSSKNCLLLLRKSIPPPRQSLFSNLYYMTETSSDTNYIIRMGGFLNFILNSFY